MANRYDVFAAYDCLAADFGLYALKTRLDNDGWRASPLLRTDTLTDEQREIYERYAPTAAHAASTDAAPFRFVDAEFRRGEIDAPNSDPLYKFVSALQTLRDSATDLDELTDEFLETEIVADFEISANAALIAARLVESNAVALRVATERLIAATRRADANL